MALTSPITGSAQTGITSPTFTLTLDKFPGNNGVQYAVTSVSGAGNGTAHTADKPFTISFERPVNYRGTQVTPQGVTLSQARNKHVIRVRKGAVAVTGQPAVLNHAELHVNLAAGVESVSPQEIRAMLSCLFGAVAQQSAAFGDQCISNVVTA